MSVEVAFRYERISPKAYEHPADRAATSALHSIPLMDTVIKRLTDIAHERRFRQILVGNAVRVGENQVPSLWADYRRCGYVLDMDTLPELYVTQTPMANAMAVGAKRPLVIVYSGLVSSYENDEVESVLADELGHVLSEHYYYTTALVLLSRFLRGSIPSPLIGLPVRSLCRIARVGSRGRVVVRQGEHACNGRSPRHLPGPHAHRRRRVRGHEPRCLHHPGDRICRRGRLVRALEQSVGRGGHESSFRCPPST